MPSTPTQTPTQSFDVLVLGAGAAGLMCALQAGRRGRRVAVLEHAERIGKKILISGGGRCNFTHLHCRPENFLSANPHFAKSALARYTPKDFLSLVEQHGIAWHEKSPGQLFCDRSAQQIVSMLEAECRAAGVRIFLHTHVQQVQHNLGFHVHTAEQTFTAPALVIATGGLSIPKMGTTGFGYQIAQQFGLAIETCRPALVPLLFSPQDQARFEDLSGVSTLVRTRFGPHDFQDKMLFTHRGLSGPAILQISSYWKAGQPITIDLAPSQHPLTAFQDATLPRTPAALRHQLGQCLPQRLADRWLDLHPPTGWANTDLAEWEHPLHAWKFVPSGTEGYEKAEVTAGGVSTSELAAKTLESRKVPGLFFIGEIVDVTGHLGGFNFQWAWASGFAAGQAV